MITTINRILYTFEDEYIFKLHYTLHFNATFLSNVLSFICTRQEKNSTARSQTRISYQEPSNVKNKLLTLKSTLINEEGKRKDEIDDNEYNQEEEGYLNQTPILEDLSAPSIKTSIEDNKISSKIMYPYFPENNGITK